MLIEGRSRASRKIKKFSYAIWFEHATTHCYFVFRQTEQFYIIKTRSWSFQTFSLRGTLVWIMRLLEHTREHAACKFLNIFVSYSILLNIVRTWAWDFLLLSFKVLERIIYIDFYTFAIIRILEIRSNLVNVVCWLSFPQNVVSFELIMAYCWVHRRLSIPFFQELTL